MYNYSLSLALFDYVPIVLSALGWYWLWRWAGLKSPQNTRLLAIGGALVVCGGLSKASWKLIIAISGESVDQLNHNLFLLMTPGFALLFVGVWRTSAQLFIPPLRDKLLLISLLLTLACPLSAAMLSDHPRGWFLALVALTTIFNTAMIIRISRYSWKRKQRLIASLFLLNLLTTFVLSGLARSGDQSESIQWLEEFINAGAQGFLALAAYQLTRKEKASNPS